MNATVSVVKCAHCVRDRDCFVSLKRTDCDHSHRNAVHKPQPTYVEKEDKRTHAIFHLATDYFVCDFQFHSSIDNHALHIVEQTARIRIPEISATRSRWFQFKTLT